MLGELLLTVVVLLIIYTFYKWATKNNDFFEKRNIKHLKPIFLVGNTGGFLLNKYTAPEFSLKIYKSFPNEAIFGMFDFCSPQLIVRDPEAIKQIAVKDFDYFEDHRPFFSEKTDRLFGNSLPFIKGKRWRYMRATLSPAFTGSKMRQMFELVAECADDVVKHFKAMIENGEQINVEMKDLFTRYTNDVIASCAFGLRINSFVEPDNEFYVNGKTILSFAGFKQTIKLLLMNKLPTVAQSLNISLSNGPVGNSFRHTILDTMQIRKEKIIQRPDMINTMMQIRDGTLRNQIDEKKEMDGDGFATVEESDVGKMTVTRDWNDDEIVAQCFIFFAAGFDTSSTLLSFASYELAINEDIQQRLYDEIVRVNGQLDGKRITYDALQKMKYLDQVISETLRKWPPGIQLDRLCVKDYAYMNGDELKFKIEKGTTLMFPVYALHNDPTFFPQPDKFDPERFNDKNKDNIIPGSYISFGIGPRNCIGSRFALMEVKAILYNLLLHFSFEPNAKTPIPLVLKKSPFKLIPTDGIHLELKPRKASI